LYNALRYTASVTFWRATPLRQSAIIQSFDLPEICRASSDMHRDMDVLIVDDSAAIRKILKRVLLQTELPFGSIYEAGDGEEAIASLKTLKVQLILSDINMPKMDGLQFLGHLKASEDWKDVPVVMITTEGSQAKVLEAVQLGAAGYVRKPFTAEQIKEKLIGIA
jgi:two-component system chemotaxis response regulator CheY